MLHPMDFATAASLFRYDPETGKVFWRIPVPRRRIGDEAGSVYSTGYRVIRYKGECLMAHRLAWLLHYGEAPPDLIDHVNGDTCDNRIGNLRLADHAQNNWNRKINPGQSGFRGVFRSTSKTRKPRWRACINVRGTRVYLGTFATPEEASKARAIAARQLHGEFAVD
jgi:hypothetical protein